MQDKTDVISQATAQLGAVITYISFWWAWIGENHVQIAALCAIIGAAMSIFGYRSNKKHKKQLREILKDQGLDSYMKAKNNIK